MKIEAKPALLGKSFKVHNVRADSEDGDEGGDAGELVAARAIPLKKIMITKSQINKLIGKQAYNSFFNDGVKPPEPAFPKLKAFRLADNFKDCSALLQFGVSAKTIEIEDGARIKNVSLTPCVGGVCELSCTLIASLPRALTTLDLESFIGKEITVSLEFGEVDDEKDSKQSNLALEGEEQRDDETQRQLGEALRGLEAQQPADNDESAPAEGEPNGSKRARRKRGQDAAAGDTTH